MRTPTVYAQEWLSIISAYWWAACLLFAPHLFAISPAYHAMAGIAPQPVWALLFIGGGTAQLGALIVIRRSWFAQMIVTTGAVATWAFVATALADTSIWTPGVGFFAALSLFQLRRLWLERSHATDDASTTV